MFALKLSPLAVLVIPSLFSILIWIIVPNSWFDFYGIKKQPSHFSVFIPWFYACVFFSVGFFFRKKTCGPRAEYNGSASSGNQCNFHLILWGALAFISSIFVLFNCFSKFGFTGLLNGYRIKDSYIPGVTTLVHGSTTVLVCFAASRIRGYKVSRKAFFLTLFCLIFALHRSIFGAERLAIFLPLTAIFFIFCANYLKSLSRKFFLVIIGLTLLLISTFCALEYYRSYLPKQRHGYRLDSPIVYSIKRGVMYFGSSVNTGSAAYLMRNEDSAALFSNTAIPIFEILDSVLRIEPIYLTSHTEGSRLIQSYKFYNPELNNVWGVISPYLEAFPVGCLFWLLWGAVGGQLYVRAYSDRATTYDLSLFGIYSAALLDSAMRVNILGASPFLFPFLGLALSGYLFKNLYLSESKFLKYH